MFADAPSSQVALFFPAEAANGTLRLSSSGARIFTGNGWSYHEPGIMRLPLHWTDKKDGSRQVLQTWVVELQSGRYVLGAERNKELLKFTLTKEGEPKPFMCSDEYEIGHWHNQ
jgi:hypothetical protein